MTRTRNAIGILLALIAALRVCKLYDRHFELQLNLTLLRETCTLDALEQAWAFAKRHDMYFHVDLANYSAPFFVHGPPEDVHAGNNLFLREEDRPQAEEVARAMLALKRAEPERFVHSLEFIRSVPDWLLKGAAMRVPCDAYEMLW